MIATLFVVATGAFLARAAIGIAGARSHLRRFEAEIEAEIEAEARFHSENDRTPPMSQEVDENPMHAIAFSSSLISAAKVHANTTSVEHDKCSEHSSAILEVDQAVR